MLNDVAGSIAFSLASPDPFTSITGAQGEPALICEKHRAPVADMPILVFYSKCQSSSTVLGSEHRAHCRTSCPEATLMKSVSDISLAMAATFLWYHIVHVEYPKNLRKTMAFLNALWGPGWLLRCSCFYNFICSNNLFFITYVLL